MLGTILLILLVIVLVVVLLAFTKPKTFRVERSASIEAPPEAIFPLVNDFHEWKRWSPWEKIDPSMERTYGGSGRGMGATYSWSGNKKAGSGRMEITDSIPPTKVVIDLHFMKPFEARNTTEFTFKSRGTGSHANWAMYGPMPFASRVMSVFVSMDKLIGKDFDEGMRNLKREAETKSAVA